LSVKAAARRTHGQVSDGRWYQLESGYQKIQGHSIPIGTTPATVAAAAQAVKWDVDDALRTAGFDPEDYQPPQDHTPLEDVSTEVLWEQFSEISSELRRRVGGQAAGVPPSRTDERERKRNNSRQLADREDAPPL
jgi:hypothetical protein